VIAPLQPEWPAPAGVRAFMTTRAGGASHGSYESLNLGARCGDRDDAVAENRRRVRELLPRDPFWLEQVHGVEVADADAQRAGAPPPQADASIARRVGSVCAIQVADCLPVLFAEQSGSAVAAAHAGWRGLQRGVLPATVAALGVEPGSLLAWLGPAIGPRAYEVGDEVRDAFVARSDTFAAAFSPVRAGHWLFDLFAAARLELQAAGIRRIYGGGVCVHSDPQRFFSFRRDGATGRMAAFVWLESRTGHRA
jgi:YfiH family protein